MLFLATDSASCTAPPPRHTASQATQMQRASVISSLFLICLVLGDAMCAASVKREQYTTLPFVGKAVSLYEKYMPILTTAERMYTDYAATCNFGQPNIDTDQPLSECIDELIVGEVDKSPSEIINAVGSIVKRLPESRSTSKMEKVVDAFAAHANLLDKTVDVVQQLAETGGDMKNPMVLFRISCCCTPSAWRCTRIGRS